MKKLVARGRPGRRSRRAVALGVAALAVGMAVPTAASADMYISKGVAQRFAKDYVSRHYEDTYSSDLTALCGPRRGRYNPGYVYHQYVCAWHDWSDDTYGAVLITGSRVPGAYHARVLIEAH